MAHLRLSLIVTLLLLSIAKASFAFPFGWPRDVTASGDRAWSLWNLFWTPDSTVTVVDRENPVTFVARPASFGSELKHPLLGYVIPLSSFTEPCPNSTISHPGNWGCSPLCQTGKASPSPSEPWIALVQRGHCSFADKAREAQRLGAKAVVVGGDDPATTGHPDSLVSMFDPGASPNINVAATFIRFSDYSSLISLINSSETIHSGLQTVSLLVGSDTPTGGWFSPAITFITILLLPSFLTFITLVIHRFRLVRAARRERAPEDIVRSLPWRVWTGHGWEKHLGSELLPADNGPNRDVEAGSASSSRDGTPDANRASSSAPVAAPSSPPEGPSHPWAETQTECAICLSEFEVGDRVRVLPCDHIFHLDEVDGWLIHNKKLCPVCKADVTQPPAAYVPFGERRRGPDQEEQAVDQSAMEPTEETPLLGSR